MGIDIHLFSHRWSSDAKKFFHSLLLYWRAFSEINDHTEVVSGKKITTYWSIGNNHKNQTLNYLLWQWICICFCCFFLCHSLELSSLFFFFFCSSPRFFSTLPSLPLYPVLILILTPSAFFSVSSFAVRVIVICLLCIFKMSQRTGISRGKWWCYRHRMLPYFICLNTMHLMWTILFEGRSRNVNMLSKQERENRVAKRIYTLNIYTIVRYHMYEIILSIFTLYTVWTENIENELLPSSFMAILEDIQVLNARYCFFSHSFPSFFFPYSTQFIYSILFLLPKNVNIYRPRAQRKKKNSLKRKYIDSHVNRFKAKNEYNII